MSQHILLMAVAPPLILLGAPALPLLFGLPKRFVRRILGPVLRWRPVRRLGSTFTHPAFCWLSATITVIVWHLPSVFEFALHSESWHEVEHACFFTTLILSGGQSCSHGQVSLDGLDGLYPCTFFSASWRMMQFRQFSLFGTVFSTRRMPLQISVSSIFHRSTIRPSREH
jgi:hypothetical protein